jgi:hypothetical protein
VITKGTPARSRWTIAVLGAVTAALMLAPAAHAAGTVTVGVQGQGSATGEGINCTQSGGDCSETYADEQVEFCFPPAPGKPDICETSDVPPRVEFTAGNDSNGFVFDGWTGCDSVTDRVCELTVHASTTVTARFRDNQNPSVSAPTPNSGVRRGIVTLAATASDNAGVSKVEFYNGASKIGEDGAAPYELSWNTTTVSDGLKSITAKAYDAAGRIGTSAASGFTVDNTAPTLSVTGGPNGQTFGPGTTQTWNFTATDVTSTVTALCRVRSASSTPAFSACSGANTTHAISNLPDGSYTFEAFARDAGQLESAVQSRTFAIDATPPDTTVTSGPADGSSSTDTTAVFGFSANQAASTFQCRVYPAALTPPAFGGCSAGAGHTATGFAPGTYSFEVRATDPYGNTDASPAKRTFTVTAPSGGTDPGTGGTTDPGTGGTTTGGAGGTTSGGGTTPGTTTTTTITTIVTTTAFDPRITGNFAYKGAKTRVVQLAVTRLPKGAKVQFLCAGKGCPFKRKSIANKGAKLNVLKALKRLTVRAGAVLQLRITGAAGEQKVATWKVRRGRPPSTTYRCATTRGAKLGPCA